MEDTLKQTCPTCKGEKILKHTPASLSAINKAIKADVKELWYECITCHGTGEKKLDRIFSSQALLAAAEEGRREGRETFIKWLRESSKYKLMQKTASGKYYENLLEKDWLSLKEKDNGWREKAG